MSPAASQTEASDYDAGYEAHLTLMRFGANPHEVHTTRHIDWADGWEEAAAQHDAERSAAA